MNKIKTFSDFVNESGTEFSKYSAINEEEFSLSAFFSNLKNYGKKIAEIEAIRTSEWEMKMEKERVSAEMAEKIKQKGEDFDDKKESIIRKKLKGMSPKQKEAARAQLGETFTEKRKAYIAKLTVKKTTYERDQDQAIKKAGTDAITELENEYPTQGYLEAKYQSEKVAIESKLQDKYEGEIEDMKMASIEATEDPERIKAEQDRAKKRQQTIDQERKKRAGELEKDLNDKKTEHEASLTGASQETKDGLAAVQKFYTAVKTYTGIASQITALKNNESSFSDTYSYEDLISIINDLEGINEADDDAAKLKDLTKKLTDAKKEMGVPSLSMLKKAFGDDAKATSAHEDMTALASEAEAAYTESKAGGENAKAEDLDTVDDGAGDDEEETTTGYDDEAAKTSAINAAKADKVTAEDAVKTKKAELVTLNAKAEDDFPGTTPEEKKEAKSQAVKSLEGEITAAEVVVGDKQKAIDAADAKGIKKAAKNESNSYPSHETHITEKRRNTMSFSEFVNESRKNS
jgi:hypothetical protein